MKGYSLIELMLTVAIAALVLIPIARFFSSNLPLYHRTQVRQQGVINSRMALDTIVERLRNGRARSLVISTPAATPIVPNCRVDFVLQTALPSGATAYTIFLDGGMIFTQEFALSPPAPTAGAQPRRTLASNVVGLMFAGSSQDPGVVSVTLQMAAPLDATGNQSNADTVFLPNQIVHMVESQ